MGVLNKCQANKIASGAKEAEGPSGVLVVKDTFTVFMHQPNVREERVIYTSTSSLKYGFCSEGAAEGPVAWDCNTNV